MHVIKYVSLLFICWVILLDCTNNSSPEYTTLKNIYTPKSNKRVTPDTVYSILPDSSFLSNVYWITHGKTHFYLSDYTNNRIVRIDTGYSVSKSYGQRGRGQGEFVGPGVTQVSGDTLFVMDEGNRRIDLFTTDGDWIKSIRSPAVVTTRFAVRGKRIFLSTPLLASPITEINFSGKIIRQFGE
ncbi:MAG TPA: hypothetical protein VE912_14045 [Bacteroidales bacterium]|nr:hypothetical protein [Bacteroidales bacterium]